MKKNAFILYDPIPFEGGSKIATRHMLEQTHNQVCYHILTADRQSWHHFCQNTSLSPHCIILYSLWCPLWLQKKSQGIFYWIKQLILLLNLLFLFCLIVLKFSLIPQKILLISSPSVDLAGYLLAAMLKLFISFSLIQFIHGGGFCSRAVVWCLKQQHLTFYLQSVEAGLKDKLGVGENEDLPKNFRLFVNGIPQKKWPSQQKKYNQKQVQILWAASLVKWKGLDIFIKACQQAKFESTVTTNICYIKPENTDLAQSQKSSTLPKATWFEAPSNLDEIRAKSHIFVSTSQNEPFGLSILEALAAGLLVVIPNDGAYWDKLLVDGKDCLKYEANNVESLAYTLLKAVNQLESLQPIAKRARDIAKNYQAEKTYIEIAKNIIGNKNSLRVIA